MIRKLWILLQKDYLIHKDFIEKVVRKKEYHFLFDKSHLNYETQEDIELLNVLIADTKSVYQPFLSDTKEGDLIGIKITDTLTSKILLGVYGVVPAYDRYFKEAARLHGISGQFNNRSFKQIQEFYNRNHEVFSSFIEETKQDNMRYTPMKVIDMYFWKVAEIVSQTKDSSMIERLINFSSDSRAINSFVPIRSDGNLTSGNSTQVEGIRNFITEVLLAKKAEGEDSVDIVARDIHVAVKLKNNYPSVCSAMSSLPMFNKYEVIYAPPSGKSSTVTYRYILG